VGITVTFDTPEYNCPIWCVHGKEAPRDALGLDGDGRKFPGSLLLN